MASVDMQDLVERFDEFYRAYYEDEIADLAQHYPAERRSLFLDWTDLYRFDEDLAEDVRRQPDQLLEYAGEALRLFDLPVDVTLGQAHVRFTGLPDATPIRDIRAEHVNRLVSVRGIVRKSTGVKPKVEETAFECQRCGTITRIMQADNSFQEPHQCGGCERQGPFRINFDQSTFIDAQKVRIQESPEGLRGGETPESIDVHLEDDLTGLVSPGDNVSATGVLRMEQQEAGGEPTALFDVYMDGMAIEAEDEQFDEMDITDEDERRILELAEEDDIYERMVDSIAPSIYGHEKAKLAMVLQLFSGVTKHLPDGSRTRGDMHMLLIGDPGTGKCCFSDTSVMLSDGREREIGRIVEENLTNPVEIDDGYCQEADISVLTYDGKKVEAQTATRVWKREAPESLCRITTESGKTVEVTPSHPLFIQRKSTIEPAKAESLEEGDFIAVPNRISVDGDDSIDVTVRSGSRGKINDFKIPGHLSEEWARYLGYVIGEGYVVESNNTVVVTNQDQEIIEDISNILSKIGLQYRVKEHHTNERSKVVKCSSTQLVRFFRKLEPAILERSPKQKVPELIQRATLPKVAAFLKAYIDGECTVSPKERGISVSSMSEELLHGVRNLLLRFSIGSQIHSKQPHDSYRLRISGDDFDRYVTDIGFVTERKSTAAQQFADTDGNTNRDVIPDVGTHLKDIRTKLRLSQFECGIPRTTYQHYERGDRNPSRASLRKVVTAFEDRIEELEEFVDRLERRGWHAVEPVRKELGVSQAAIAARTDVTQTAISYYERNKAIPDGGVAFDAEGLLAEELHKALAARPVVDALRRLVDADIGWDRIDEIEYIECEDEWVYDLEVEGTHNYIANGIVSHNSALLQYIRNIAPRSVYTSGKGSSSAGLTAAAVRDDFGDGQQWSLEAGALVLADQGIAAIDELDKMRCVTGDTIVAVGDGSESRIDAIADRAKEGGAIEELPNGRTIRDVDIAVWTMTADERLVRRPIQAVHEYEAPDTLYEVTLENGQSVRTTADHPFILREDDVRVERPASELTGGESVYCPHSTARLRTDGGVTPVVENAGTGAEHDVETAEIVRVREITPDPSEHVYDLTVDGTHNFVANGMVIHNSEDRSALHEGLEAQEISISKAGINATLKARCSLLGAANPQYGRFDPYEPMGEQIDLEPALISRFDLIFTITDKPDPDSDRDLAQHILETNYAGELHTQRTKLTTPDVSEADLEAVSHTVTPAIDPELFRKYVAFAQQSCYPRMTKEARDAIQEFYVDLRSRGADEDAPVPVTARKLEALVRLSEASARVRLSDTVELDDAERVIELVRDCLQDIGVDPETGQFDADVIETGRSKTQRDRVRNIKGIIRELQDEHDEGAPLEDVLTAADEAGIERSKAEHQIQKLRDQGEVYSPTGDYLRVV